jgi:alkaline phosphatase D
MKKGFILLVFLVSFHFVWCQDQNGIVAGPMLGFVELRTANIWCEVSHSTQKVSISYKKDGGSSASSSVVYKGTLGQEYNPVSFQLTGLDFNTSYQYEITALAGQKAFRKSGKFRTTDLWQFRKNAPDIVFLTGSCAYFNEPPVDRKFAEISNPHTPAKPYGGDSSIFESMAKENAAFTLWLGDNWYYREVDFASEWGLNYRASLTRRLPVMQNLMKAMPQLAIWDDHDYGHNDADKTFPMKKESLDIFKKYWANPSYGDNGEGIYTKYSYSDVEFFLMDDRWYRSNDKMSPTINGKPNEEKRMWGEKQMDWLKNALAGSLATFKFIVTGSQTLNPISPFDCLQSYPAEFNELMEFLNSQKVSGVIFLTGDRHHSEVIKYERPQAYPLYDVTSSPFTSGIGRVFGNEINNPARIAGTLVEAQNYTRVSISGVPGARSVKVEFLGIKGEKLAEWNISAQELQWPK